MASNSQFLDTSQDVDKKSAHEPDSSTLSQSSYQGGDEISDPQPGPSTPPSSSHDVPQDVESDSDSDEPLELPAQRFPTGLLRFIRPDNYLIRFVEEFNVNINNPRDITYRYPRARG